MVVKILGWMSSSISDIFVTVCVQGLVGFQYDGNPKSLRKAPKQK